MSVLAWIAVAAPAALLAYAYAAYPLLLRIAAARNPTPRPAHPREWPAVTITVPAYNEERTIRRTLETLLELDYPPEKRHILVVSDASTDRTDEIVSEFGDGGVELLRLPRRRGKTGAENAALARIRGEIVVNTDASVRVDRRALKRLVAALADPSVGVASGRDVSVATLDSEHDTGEAGYVGYEMKIRDWETRAGGIIGASGCLYAIRAHLHRAHIPEGLSRDFAAALIARAHGFRAVSVPDAICTVPRTADLAREYRRKVRTFARGMQTLAWKRALLNPFRYGAFSWMLWSHKVCRWVFPWVAAAAAAALAVASPHVAWSRWVLAAAACAGVLGAAGALWPRRWSTPRALAWPAFFLAGSLAVLHASLRVLRRQHHAVWEPTRRDAVRSS